MFHEKDWKLNETFAMMAIGNCYSNSFGTFHFSEIPIEKVAEIKAIKCDNKSPENTFFFHIIFFRLKINLMFAKLNT